MITDLMLVLGLALIVVGVGLFWLPLAVMLLGGFMVVLALSIARTRAV